MAGHIVDRQRHPPMTVELSYLPELLWRCVAESQHTCGDGMTGGYWLPFAHSRFPFVPAWKSMLFRTARKQPDNVEEIDRGTWTSVGTILVRR